MRNRVNYPKSALKMQNQFILAQTTQCNSGVMFMNLSNLKSFLALIFFATSFQSHASGNHSNCTNMVARVLENGYEQNIKRALEEKNLVHRSYNRLTIQRPGPSLFARSAQRAERFFSRVINDNRYPAYYIFDEAETVPKIIAYVRSYVGQGRENATNTRNATRDFGPEIRKWIEDYENYNSQIEDLVKARVSMAYNLDLLKYYRKDAPDFDRVTLSFYRNGEFEDSVFTFRSDDENLTTLIRDLESEISRFDGGVFTKSARENTRLGYEFISEGVIRGRVLEQSKLRDKLVLLHREVEFAYHNLDRRAEFQNSTEEGRQALSDLYERLTRILNDEEMKPSAWAVNKTSREKMFEEMKQSVRSNKRIARMQERGEVIRQYLTEGEVSRAKLISRGLGFYTRSLFYATPGVLTVSGAVTMFDLDEKLANLYDNYLVWRYGKKMQCVRERTDQAYLNCLYRHYEREYPEIMKMALKNPTFNPWDFDAIRELPLGSEMIDLYISDIQEMQKFREYFKYIQQRREEIKQLFMESHQRIIDGVVHEPIDVAPCVAVSRDQLAPCLYDSIYSRLVSMFGKIDDDFNRDDFPFDNYDRIPDIIRDEYKREVEDILYQRSIYEDLNQLDGYQFRIFFRD